MDQVKTMKYLKKYHKWPSLALTFFILLFAISGIVMNHRGAFSSVDVDRKYLGSEYQYSNWNKAAVKSAVTIQGDTALITAISESGKLPIISKHFRTLIPALHLASTIGKSRK